jgi:hypothetical protein
LSINSIFYEGGIYIKEVDLRKWHRRIGIMLALFVILQAGSGLLVGLGDLSSSQTHAHSEPTVSSGGHEEAESPWHEALEFIHHGVGSAGTRYRIIVVIGIHMDGDLRRSQLFPDQGPF